MSGDKGSSKTDTLVKVVLVFFISLLSFSVGTFVGKQVSDSDHRRLALESEYGADRKLASAEESENKISEKEVESLTEEFVNKEKGREPAEAHDDHAAAEAGHDAHGAKPEEKHETAEAKPGYKSYPRKGEAPAHAAPASEEKGKTAKAEAAPAKEEAKKADGASKAADKVAAGKAPTDGKKEERKPQAALPSVAASSVGKYTVQVASYLAEAEAKAHAAELKGKGWQAFYLSADVKGKTYFRVLVGLFDSQGSANTFRAQFMKEANTKNALVQKIVQ